ncbi:MAG TPA: DALR domain-containing protein [Candidatus Azoamicus sp.]
MNDDLNSAKAISVLFEILNSLKKRKNISYLESQKLIYTIKFLGNTIGLFKYNPKDFLEKKISIPKNILNLVRRRHVARRESNWILADSLRDEIFKFGFKVSDNDDFTSVELIC